VASPETHGCDECLTWTLRVIRRKDSYASKVILVQKESELRCTRVKSSHPFGCAQCKYVCLHRAAMSDLQRLYVTRHLRQGGRLLMIWPYKNAWEVRCARSVDHGINCSRINSITFYGPFGVIQFPILHNWGGRLGMLGGSRRVQL